MLPVGAHASVIVVFLAGFGGGVFVAQAQSRLIHRISKSARRDIFIVILIVAYVTHARLTNAIGKVLNSETAVPHAKNPP
jgi:hypothetical protein